MNDESVKKAANMVISDEEFSQALHDVAFFVKNFFDTQHASGMPAAIHVFTRHNFKDKLEHIVIVIPGFPPPIGAVVSRYDLLEMAGAKYFTEMVKQKPAGKKCYPLAIFINSEAWMRMEQTKKRSKNFEQAKEEVKQMKSFADSPDKQEIYVSAGMTLDNRNNLAFLPITRLKNDVIMMKNPEFQEYKKENMSGSDLLISFYRGFMRALQKDSKGGE